MPHFFRTICQAGLIFTAAFFAATSVAHPPTPPWEECACEDEQFTITLNTTHPDDEIHLVPEKDFYRRGEAVAVVSTPGPGRSFLEWDTPQSLQSAYGLTGSVNQIEYLYVDGSITIEAITAADRTLSLGYANPANGHVEVLSDHAYTDTGNGVIVTVPHGETVALNAVGATGTPFPQWRSAFGPPRYGFRFESEVNVNLDNFESRAIVPMLIVFHEHHPLGGPTPWGMNFTVVGGQADVYTDAFDPVPLFGVSVGPYLHTSAQSGGAFSFRVVPRSGFARRVIEVHSGGSTYPRYSFSGNNVDGGDYTVYLSPEVSLDIEVVGEGVVRSADYQAGWEPDFHGSVDPNENSVLLNPVACSGVTFSHWEYDAGDGWESPGPGDIIGNDALRLYMTWKEGDGIRLKEGEEVMKVRAVFEGECPRVDLKLSFDDGPQHVDNRTQKVIDALASNSVQNGIKAAFFVQTHVPNRGGSPEGQALMQAAAAAGHHIEIHTGSVEDHVPHWIRVDDTPGEDLNGDGTPDGLTKLDTDLIRAKARILQLTGRTPIFVRPPFGELEPQQGNADLKEAVEAAYARQGLELKLWEVDSKDTGSATISSVNTNLTNQITARIGQGQKELVVLFHDIFALTPDNLPEFLETMRDAVESTDHEVFFTWP